MTKLVLSSQGIFKAGLPLLLFLDFLFVFLEVWLLYNVFQVYRKVIPLYIYSFSGSFPL